MNQLIVPLYRISGIMTVTNIYHFSVLHTDRVIGRFRKTCIFCSLCIQSPVVQKWIEGGKKVYLFKVVFLDTLLDGSEA